MVEKATSSWMRKTHHENPVQTSYRAALRHFFKNTHLGTFAAGWKTIFNSIRGELFPLYKAPSFERMMLFYLLFTILSFHVKPIVLFFLMSCFALWVDSNLVSVIIGIALICHATAFSFSSLKHTDMTFLFQTLCMLFFVFNMSADIVDLHED